MRCFSHMLQTKIDKSRYCITVLGDGGSGKTAVTIMFTSNHFVEYYDPTIESNYKRQIVVDDQAVILEILDTAGQDEFTAMQSQWISFGNAFVLLYDITKRASFDRTKNFHHKINMVKDCDVRNQPPIVLLGNKVDLEDQREVSTEEGEELAKELKATFFETSALANTNISEAFIELTRQIRVYYRLNVLVPENGEKAETKKAKKGLCILL
uniref:Uncharacterized protein n=1 Tax=Vannella robusta TaxID=1487602 RepID=A0A7S4II12_9EUKA